MGLTLWASIEADVVDAVDYFWLTAAMTGDSWDCTFLLCVPLYHTSTFGVHLASCYVLMNATTVTTTTTTADFGHEHRRSWSIQDFPLLLLLGHP